MASFFDIAFDLIGKSTVRDQNRGLAELKQIFSKDRRDPRLNDLDNRQYHSFFLELQELISRERSAYLRANKTSRARVEGKLTTVASIFRSAVELSVRILLPKTVKILLEHILKSVSVSEDRLCEPLVDDYIRSLKSLLGHRSHVEHFPPARWLGVVDFCVDGLQLYTIAADDLFPNPIALHGSHRSHDQASGSSTPSTLTSSIAPGRDSSTTTGKIREDFLICLSRILSVSNASTVDRAQALSSALLALLQVSSPDAQGNQHIFSCINSILSCCMTENISLIQGMVQAVIPQAKRLWQTRYAVVKEEILTMLIYSQIFFNPVLRSIDGAESEQDLRGLLGVMQSDLMRRRERDLLQMEDLSFLDNLPGMESASILSTTSFCLRSGSTKCESTWAIMHIIGSIFASISKMRHPPSPSNRPDNSPRPAKRQKLSNPLDELLQLLATSSSDSKVAALQVLSFVVDKTGLEPQVLWDTIEQLTDVLRDEVGNHTPWAILLLST